MRLTIFGSTGPTGLLLTRGALDRGHDVTVLVRRPEALSLTHPKLRVLMGDVLQPGSLPPALAGQDAVISSIGLPYTRKPIRLYSEGTGNIMSAMEAAGVKRLVVISSGGTAPGVVKENAFFFERIIKPIFRTFYDDMRKMEALISASDLEWTTIRPPRLLDAPPRGTTREAIGAYGLEGGSKISRADVARVTLDALDRPELVRAAVAIAW
jgi:putative NADH-flavin reductase